MRAALCLLDDAALERCQCVTQERLAPQPGGRLDAGELVSALAREMTRGVGWSSARMLIAKWPASCIACPVCDVRFMQMSIIGGSTESEVTALAVVPYGVPSTIAVTTVTPLAKWPTTSRN